MLDDIYELTGAAAADTTHGSRLAPEAVQPHLDWHNDMSGLILDVTAVEAAADDQPPRRHHPPARRALDVPELISCGLASPEAFEASRRHDA